MVVVEEQELLAFTEWRERLAARSNSKPRSRRVASSFSVMLVNQDLSSMCDVHVLQYLLSTSGVRCTLLMPSRSCVIGTALATTRFVMSLKQSGLGRCRPSSEGQGPPKLLCPLCVFSETSFCRLCCSVFTEVKAVKCFRLLRFICDYGFSSSTSSPP